MILVSGQRFWIEKNPILNKYSYLSEDVNCDIVIIGGGVIGAICAYYLTEAGIKTVLVDKNIIGFGSTSTSTSILQYEIDTDLVGLAGLIGIEKATRSFKLCEKAVYDIEKIISTLEDNCDFSLMQSLYYSSSPSDIKSLKKEYELRRENGFDVEFIDKETAKGKYSINIEAGIISNKGAAQIDPYKFSHALIYHSAKNGLQVYENTEIIDIKNNENTLTLETNKNKRIVAKKAIVSTGYEGIKYINEKIATLSRTFTIVTKPVQNFNGWYNRSLIRDNNNPYTYMRTTSDNRIIIGGEDVGLGGKSSSISTLLDAENFTNEKYNILTEKLKSLFPQIKGIEIEYKFNGVFATTHDGLPYIGEYKELPNVYFSLCYGSNGILYGVLAAQLIRDLYYNNPSPDLELFRFGR
mgnify:CR=1 FL=1